MTSIPSWLFLSTKLSKLCACARVCFPRSVTTSQLTRGRNATHAVIEWRTPRRNRVGPAYLGLVSHLVPSSSALSDWSQSKSCKIPTDPSHDDLFFFPKAKLVLSFAPALHSSVRSFGRTMRAFSLTRFPLFEHPHPSAVAKSEIGTPLSLVVGYLSFSSKLMLVGLRFS